MISQKGQSIVEFAIVLPLFFLLIFGISYVGMVLADYMELSDIARSSARDASTITDAADYAHGYQNIINKYSTTKLPFDIFTWDTSENHFTITYDKNNQNVTVVLTATINDDGKTIANVFYRLVKNKSVDDKFSLKTTYTMYSEYKPTK